MEAKEMNRIKTVSLLTCLTLLLVAMGNLIGGQSGMIIAFLIAGGMNFFTYWYSDKIVLKMYKAREVSEADHTDFYGMVRHLALQANMPIPKVYIIPSEAPNAFATGRNLENAAVAATEGIMRLLTTEELEGVMGHDLAHVENRDTLIGTVAFIAPMLAMLLQMAVSRSREYLADAAGERICGKPLALANLHQGATGILQLGV